jgi:DNA polymerase alpha-associated DNA helicase A
MLYSEKLISHESVKSHLLCDLQEVKTKPISEEDQRDVLGTPIVFFDTSGCEFYERLDGGGEEGSRCNENEAVVVKRWVDQLVRSITHGVVEY